MRNRWRGALIAVLMFASGAASAADPGATAMQAGSTFRDFPDGPEMVVVPAGDFLMGSSVADTTRDLDAITNFLIASDARVYMRDEHPQQSVHIEQSFGLGKYPVTRAEFAAFVHATGYSTSGGCTFFDNHKYRNHHGTGWQDPGFPQSDRDPAVCVSWQDAQAYIAWLNDKLRDGSPRDGEGPYRLPSEAEWEYAARAGQQTARWWGNDIGSNNADCDGCGSIWDMKRTAPVGSFRANPFGLSDMLGNAWQLTEDCWNTTYEAAPSDGSAWTTGKCGERVMRGGSWNSSPWILRSANRARADADERHNYIGFRVARTLP